MREPHEPGRANENGDEPSAASDAGIARKRRGKIACRFSGAGAVTKWTSAASILYLLFSCQTCFAASQQMTPALKAIDPSQAKFGVPVTPPPAPSPEPSGPSGPPPQQAGYPAPNTVPYGAPAYPAQPGYGAPPQGYSPAPQGYGAPPSYGAPPQGYPAPQSYPMPPAYGAPPTYYQQPPPQQMYAPPAQPYTPPPQQPYTPPPQPSGSQFPSEQQIPEFGKPLPVPTQAPGDNTNYGGGFVTQPPGGGRQPYFEPAPGGPSPYEDRVVRLEQAAFGSSYPEHEVEDRVDHLEKEVFGGKSSGPVETRIAKLEQKLGAGGNLGRNSVPPRPPGPPSVVAQRPPAAPSYPPPVQYPPAAQGGYPPPQTGYAPPLTQQNPGETGSSPDGGAPNTVATDPAVQEAVSKIPIDDKAGDYLPNIHRFPGDAVVRWNHLPVKVHIPEDSAESWKKHLDADIKKWNEYIPMQVVGAHDPADIEVVWQNHLVPRVLGVTRLTLVQGQAQVQIFLLRPTFYLPEIPEHSLQGVFLHELGHALGLYGHSTAKSDIMYPCEVSQGAKGKPSQIHFAPISARDLNTLKRVYESPLVPPNTTMPQPLEWAAENGEQERTRTASSRPQ